MYAHGHIAIIPRLSRSDKLSGPQQQPTMGTLGSGSTTRSYFSWQVISLSLVRLIFIGYRIMKDGCISLIFSWQYVCIMGMQKQGSHILAAAIFVMWTTRSTTATPTRHPSNLIFRMMGGTRWLLTSQALTSSGIKDVVIMVTSMRSRLPTPRATSISGTVKVKQFMQYNVQLSPLPPLIHWDLEHRKSSHLAGSLLENCPRFIQLISPCSILTSLSFVITFIRTPNHFTLYISSLYDDYLIAYTVKAQTYECIIWWMVHFTPLWVKADACIGHCVLHSFLCSPTFIVVVVVIVVFDSCNEVKA